MRTRNKIIALATAAAFATPAMAQWTGEQTQSDRNRQNQQSWDRSQDQNQRQRQSQRQGQNQRQGENQLDWERTTIIGYDLDGDGYSDYYYAATVYEVEQMRRKAQQQRQQMTGQQARQMQQRHQQQMRDKQMRDRQRQAQQRGDYGQRYTDSQYRQRGQDQRFGESRMGNQYDQQMPDRQMRQAQRDRQMRDQQRSQGDAPMTVSGTVKGVKSFNLTGMDQPRTVARIETDRGRQVAVVLGAKPQVDRMNLSSGDQVKLRVSEGKLNDRKVFVADRIQSKGTTHTINQPRTPEMHRVTGQIVSTITRTFQSPQGQQQRHLLLKVRGQDGNVRTITLGPASQRDADRLSQGQKITVLAKPKQLGGQQILSAHQIHHNGQTKQITPASDYRTSARDQRRDDRSAYRGGN